MKRNKENNKSKTRKPGRHEHPLPGQIDQEKSRQNANALEQAEKDMADDAEFVAHNKNNDLDEGE